MGFVIGFLVFTYYLLDVIMEKPEFTLHGCNAHRWHAGFVKLGKNPPDVAIGDCGYVPCYIHERAPDFNRLLISVPQHIFDVNRVFPPREKKKIRASPG